MGVFAFVLLIGASSILIAAPENILADPVNPENQCHPVIHKTCGSYACENSCDEPDPGTRPCDSDSCEEGYFCKPGYLRKYQSSRGTARCILPSECPSKSTVAPLKMII